MEPSRAHASSYDLPQQRPTPAAHRAASAALSYASRSHPPPAACCAAPAAGHRGFGQLPVRRAPRRSPCPRASADACGDRTAARASQQIQPSAPTLPASLRCDRAAATSSLPSDARMRAGDRGQRGSAGCCCRGGDTSDSSRRADRRTSRCRTARRNCSSRSRYAGSVGSTVSHALQSPFSLRECMMVCWYGPQLSKHCLYSVCSMPSVSANCSFAVRTKGWCFTSGTSHVGRTRTRWRGE